MERRGAIYDLLARAWFYDLFQLLVGASRARRTVVRELLDLHPGERLLDVACGAGWLVSQLPAGLGYVGYDYNPAYIERAIRRYGDRGRFHVASVREASSFLEPRTFDVVVAFGMLHHLSDSEARALVAQAASVLTDRGRLVCLDGVLHEGQSAVSRWLVSRDRGPYVRSVDGYRRLLAPDFRQVSMSVRTRLMRIPYSLCIGSAREPRRDSAAATV
jgi:ubiquinone/menaquinone biosynthesis C-methylase UbiE